MAKNLIQIANIKSSSVAGGCAPRPLHLGSTTSGNPPIKILGAPCHYFSKMSVESYIHMYIRMYLAPRENLSNQKDSLPSIFCMAHIANRMTLMLSPTAIVNYH